MLPKGKTLADSMYCIHPTGPLQLLHRTSTILHTSAVKYRFSRTRLHPLVDLGIEGDETRHLL